MSEAPRALDDANLLRVSVFAAKVAEPSSGQYVFAPVDLAHPLSTSTNRVLLTRGPVRQRLLVQGNPLVQLVHTVVLDRHAHALGIRNEFDISARLDFELGMRLSMGAEQWDAAEQQQFYTDLNGFSVRGAVAGVALLFLFFNIF